MLSVTFFDVDRISESGGLLKSRQNKKSQLSMQ